MAISISPRDRQRLHSSYISLVTQWCGASSIAAVPDRRTSRSLRPLAISTMMERWMCSWAGMVPTCFCAIRACATFSLGGNVAADRTRSTYEVGARRHRIGDGRCDIYVGNFASDDALLEPFRQGGAFQQPEFAASQRRRAVDRQGRRVLRLRPRRRPRFGRAEHIRGSLPSAPGTEKLPCATTRLRSHDVTPAALALVEANHVDAGAS